MRRTATPNPSPRTQFLRETLKLSTAPTARRARTPVPVPPRQRSLGRESADAAAPRIQHHAGSSDLGVAGPPNPRCLVHPNTAPLGGPLPSRGPAGVRAARAGFRLARVSARPPPPRLSRRLSRPYSFLRLQAPSPPSRTETRGAERPDAGPESARCASSSRTPPSCRGKGERVRENFIKTPPKGGQAPHCACALAVPLKRADEGRACALWSLFPPTPFLSTPPGWG